MPQGVELATAWVRVVPSLEGVTTAVTTGFAPAAGIAEKEGRKAGGFFSSGIGAALKSAGIAFAGLFAAQKIVQGFQNAVNAASDLREAGTAVQAVFGDSFTDIEKWSKGAATALGTSQLEALNAAKTFGIYGQSAGLAGQANVEFSTGLATLAGDLASFHNTSPEEAIIAIGAALRGENEPIRRFGVLLDDATLRQKALALGLVQTTTQALTPQQKVLAAHAAILEQTTVAQGDFARTSDGLANRQRIMAAQWEDISAKIGQLFLPAINGAAGIISTHLLPAISTAVDFLSNRLVPAVKGVFDFFAGGSTVDLASAFNIDPNSPIIAILDALRDKFQLVMQTAEPFVKALIEIGQEIWAQLAPAFDQLWKAVSPLIPQLLELWMNISPVMIILKALQPVLPVIAGLFAKIADVIGGILAKVLPIVVKLVQTLAEVLGAVLAAVLPIITGLLETLVPIFASIVEAIIPIISVILDILTPVLGVLIDILKAVVDFIVPILVPVIQFLGAIVGAIFTAIGAVLTWLWESIVKPVFDGIAAVITWVAEQVLASFGADWDTVWKAAGMTLDIMWKNIVQPVFNAIGAIFTWLWETIIQPVVDFIIEAINNWSAVTDTVGAAINVVWQGVGTVIETVRDVIAGAIQRVTDVINGVLQTFRDVAQGIRDAFDGIGQFIADAFGGIGDFIGGIAGTFSNLFGGMGDKARSFKGKLQNIAAQRQAGMGPGIGAPGTALARVQGVLGAFPGLHITDTYSTPARDAAFGIVRSPNSYHYDANNPAVDVAGPIPMLWQFANWVYSVGGWRQVLWQVAGHYDHVHVAHEGGIVDRSWPRMPGDRPDERLARLQVGETILPVGVDPVRVTRFEPEEPDDNDRRGLGPAVIIDGDVYTADIDEFFEKAERKRRHAYALSGVTI